ncbi:family 43 glycosylhydrolase [Terriglobus roseus]|uniref:Glycosyl hydrolases family 43 n=1 Tax=Terriglobus roseus TaxID=392734 RepID=A0A1G7KW47_9BACT|nr:family 43 glycosylhydrolase [Terriglobus roseus]SDF40949.1 Glycosyl hydrolases family 43 [Terriglobus roseus]
MKFRFFTLLLWVVSISICAQSRMDYSDSTRLDHPFAKDPSVIEFKGRFLMYYSIPGGVPDQSPNAAEVNGWGVGIAESKDLLHWVKVGELPQTQAVEKNGIAAPGARVIDGVVHLFYQTYGQGAKDSICHATSVDGVQFVKDAANPVYHPTKMAWSVGRAIDAEVTVMPDRIMMYFATRDPQMHKQIIGAASAPRHAKLTRGDWTDVSVDLPTLTPELPWEHICTEAPSVVEHDGFYYLFYAGGWNNEPQQIGVARSHDGIHFTRLSDEPLLTNGAKGSWNSSESGHPGVLQVGNRTFLFFQGNDDGGKTYHLSKVEIGWRQGRPYVIPDSSGATASPSTK